MSQFITLWALRHDGQYCDGPYGSFGGLRRKALYKDGRVLKALQTGARRAVERGTQRSHRRSAEDPYDRRVAAAEHVPVLCHAKGDDIAPLLRHLAKWTDIPGLAQHLEVAADIAEEKETKA